MGDRKDYIHIERHVGGFKLQIGMMGYTRAHVFATRKNERASWSVNKCLKLIGGHWVIDNDHRDKWCIRYTPRFPGDDQRYWHKTYSPPGSGRIIERIRIACSAILNKKKAARWRVEGERRRKNRNESLERYFSARRSLDAAQKLANRARVIYENALALEKEYTRTRP